MRIEEYPYEYYDGNGNSNAKGYGNGTAEGYGSVKGDGDGSGIASSGYGLSSGVGDGSGGTSGSGVEDGIGWADESEIGECDPKNIGGELAIRRPPLTMSKSDRNEFFVWEFTLSRRDFNNKNKGESETGASIKENYEYGFGEVEGVFYIIENGEERKLGIGKSYLINTDYILIDRLSLWELTDCHDDFNNKNKGE